MIADAPLFLAPWHQGLQFYNTEEYISVKISSRNLLLFEAKYDTTKICLLHVSYAHMSSGEAEACLAAYS